MNSLTKQEVFAQMHILLDAGLDMSKVFEIMLEEYSDKRKEYELLLRLFEDVVNGDTLKDAMMKSGEFNELDINVVGVGESSGRLSYTIYFLSEYYMKKVSQSKALRSALSYPVMILCFSIIVLTFMLIVIVPTFSQVYSRMGGELPALTKMLILVSSNAPVILLISVVSLLLAISLCWSQRNSRTYRMIQSSILMSVPFISHITKIESQCTYCRLMYLLSSSGVPLLESLKMVSGSMTVIHYREAVISMCDRIRYGASLSSCMSAFPSLFTKQLISMVHVGEESNRLGDMFNRSADMLAENLDSSFKSLSTYIEPLMIIVIGGIVAIILIAMYLPMFRLGMVIN